MRTQPKGVTLLLPLIPPLWVSSERIALSSAPSPPKKIALLNLCSAVSGYFLLFAIAILHGSGWRRAEVVKLELFDLQFETGAMEGQYNLLVQETGSRAVVAIKFLRTALDLSLNEAMKLKNMMPGKTINGTKVEIERLLSFLIFEGINAWSEQSQKI